MLIYAFFLYTLSYFSFTKLQIIPILHLNLSNYEWESIMITFQPFELKNRQLLEIEFKSEAFREFILRMYSEDNNLDPETLPTSTAQNVSGLKSRFYYEKVKAIDCFLQLESYIRKCYILICAKKGNPATQEIIDFIATTQQAIQVIKNKVTSYQNFSIKQNLTYLTDGIGFINLLWHPQFFLGDLDSTSNPEFWEHVRRTLCQILNYLLPEYISRYESILP